MYTFFPCINNAKILGWVHHSQLIVLFVPPTQTAGQHDDQNQQRPADTGRYTDNVGGGQFQPFGFFRAVTAIVGMFVCFLTPLKNKNSICMDIDILCEQHMYLV